MRARLLVSALLLGVVASLTLANPGPGLIFADGFEDAAGGGDPPASCNPAGPEYPPFESQGGPTTLAAVWAPQPIGSSLAQVKISGGTWEAYEFGIEDLPADDLEWFADTSNVGGGAAGADFRVVTISQCPGDFRPGPPGCSAAPGEGPFLYTSFSGPRPGFCSLDPRRRYFFNAHVGPAPCNSVRGQNVCAYRVAVIPR